MKSVRMCHVAYVSDGLITIKFSPSPRMSRVLGFGFELAITMHSEKAHKSRFYKVSPLTIQLGELHVKTGYVLTLLAG